MINKNAIIISGPSCSGKTTLLTNTKIMKKIYKKVLDKSLLENEYGSVIELDKMAENSYYKALENKNIVYHYDFLKNKSIFANNYYKILNILKGFDKLTIILCTAKRVTLHKRYSTIESLRKKNRDLIKYLNPRVICNLLKIPLIYKSEDKVIKIYLDFLKFINDFNVNTLIFDSEKNLLIKPEKYSTDLIIKNLICNE